MLNKDVILIRGKNNNYLRYIIKIFGRTVPLEIMSLDSLPEEAEKQFNFCDTIFIMDKEDEHRFREKWPEIHTNKKPICMQITETMTEYHARKYIRETLKQYLRPIIEELMDELKISRNEEEIRKQLFPEKIR